MLMNLLIGPPTMMSCLFLQLTLLVLVLRYYARHGSLVNNTHRE